MCSLCGGTVGEAVDALLQGRGPARDVRVLAWVCGLRLRPQQGGEARLDGVQLHYDATTSHAGQQRAIAQCVALWACRRFDLMETAEHVAEIASAITASAAAAACAPRLSPALRPGR